MSNVTVLKIHNEYGRPCLVSFLRHIVFRVYMFDTFDAVYHSGVWSKTGWNYSTNQPPKESTNALLNTQHDSLYARYVHYYFLKKFVIRCDPSVGFVVPDFFIGEL